MVSRPKHARRRGAGSNARHPSRKPRGRGVAGSCVVVHCRKATLPPASGRARRVARELSESGQTRIGHCGYPVRQSPGSHRVAECLSNSVGDGPPDGDIPKRKLFGDFGWDSGLAQRGVALASPPPGQWNIPGFPSRYPLQRDPFPTFLLKRPPEKPVRITVIM